MHNCSFILLLLVFHGMIYLEPSYQCYSVYQACEDSEVSTPGNLNGEVRPGVRLFLWTEILSFRRYVSHGSVPLFRSELENP